jgi:metal-responsive CopG/Arc/MetJ family transcriptional regulator
MRPNIPETLSEDIESIVETHGYSSKTEFVNDAIRRRIEELEDD